MPGGQTRTVRCQRRPRVPRPAARHARRALHRNWFAGLPDAL